MPTTNTTALYYRYHQRVSYKNSPSNTKKPKKARTEQRSDVRHAEKVQKQTPPSSSNNTSSSANVFVIGLAFTTMVTPVFSRLTTPSNTQNNQISNSSKNNQISNNTQNNQTSTNNSQSPQSYNNTQNDTVASATNRQNLNTTQSSSSVVLQPYVPATAEEECKRLSSSVSLCDEVGIRSENIVNTLHTYKENFISGCNDIIKTVNRTLQEAKEYSERSFEESKQKAKILQDHANTTIKNTIEFINKKTGEVQLKALALAEKVYNRSKTIQDETTTVVNKSRNALNNSQDAFEEGKQNTQDLFSNMQNITIAQDKKNKGTVKQYLDDEKKYLTNKTQTSVVNKLKPTKTKIDETKEQLNKTKNNLDKLEESSTEVNFTEILEKLTRISNSSSVHKTKGLLYKIRDMIKEESEEYLFLWIDSVMCFLVAICSCYTIWKTKNLMKKEEKLKLDHAEYKKPFNHIKKVQFVELKAQNIKEVEGSVNIPDTETMICRIIKFDKIKKQLEKQKTPDESTQNSALQLF